MSAVVLDFTKTPTISLCMIVKNEAHRLAPCLSSIKGEVDEIIIVDTGSEDDTNNVAKKFTDKLFYYPWNGSFAKARNHAIDKASSHWIIILDADETWEAPKGELKSFIQSLDSDTIAATVLVNTDMYHRNGKQNQDVPSVRIFRNHPEIRYASSVHEQVNLSTMKSKKVAPSDFKIKHSGYSSWEVVESKTKRNIDMLLKEYKKFPKNYNITFQIANSYGTLGLPEKSDEYLHETINNPECIPSVKASCYSMLTSNEMNRKNWGEALKYADKSLEIANHQIMARWLKATCHEVRGEISLMLHVIGEMFTIVMFKDFVFPGVKPAFDMNMTLEEMTKITLSITKQLEEKGFKKQQLVNVQH
jgi:glycosyltransferase involved in cell wall biosynthesis